MKIRRLAMLLPLLALAATPAVAGIDPVNIVGALAPMAPAGAAPPASVCSATASGYQEVPPVSSTGTGSIELTLTPGVSISYTMSYDALSGNPTAAHLHFGQPGVAGSVIAFLCGGGGKPACPAPPASLSDVILAADIVGPAAQGIAAGELAEAMAAIRAGRVYMNVHSPQFPGGEIRGAIRCSR